LNALDAYQTYLAVKQHFADTSYNYFKYNGKIRVNATTFYARKDRFFFERLARRFDGKSEELRNYYASILSAHPNYIINDLVGPKAEEQYKKWKGHQESLSYNFKQDISKIADGYRGTFDGLFKCPGGQHPILLNLYTNSEIAIETLIGFDILLECFKRWNKEIDDPIVWPDIFTFCQRYRPFLSIDDKKFKQILTKEFVA
jgi:hypothetical protein